MEQLGRPPTHEQVAVRGLDQQAHPPGCEAAAQQGRRVVEQGRGGHRAGGVGPRVARQRAQRPGDGGRPLCRLSNHLDRAAHGRQIGRSALVRHGLGKLSFGKDDLERTVQLVGDAPRGKHAACAALNTSVALP